MGIIRDNSEKALRSELEDIRQKKALWWAIRITLAEGDSKEDAPVLAPLAEAIESLPACGQWSLYFLGDNAAVLLTRNIPLMRCEPMLRKITSLLADGGEGGKDPCTAYWSDADLAALCQRISELHPATLTAEPPAPHQLLDAGFFRLSAQQRKERLRPCVLVVEDQRFSRQLVIGIIGKHHEKISAADGAEALKLYEAHAPEIVFLDIDLPLIDGQKVLDRITQVDPESFVVMLTASHMQHDVEYALKQGATGYIVKPFSKEKIDRYLSLYQKNASQKKCG